MTLPTCNKKDNSVTFPHLVYKLDFHKTEMPKQDVWKGNDILAGIIQQSKNEFDKENPTEKNSQQGCCSTGASKWGCCD